MSKDLQQLVIDGYSGKDAVRFYGEKVANGLWISEKHFIEKYFKMKGSARAGEAGRKSGLESAGGTRVLDVGCGAGRTTIPLMQAGYDVTGIDFIPEMIGEAKKIAAEKGLNVAYEVGDATALKFPDNSFDYVLFSNQGWTQIPGKARRFQALKEIYRVLRPGGIYMFSACKRTFWYDFPFWLSEWLEVRVCRALGLPILRKEYGDQFYAKEPSDKKRTYERKQYLYFSTIAETKAELERAGFTLLEADGSLQISATYSLVHPPVIYVCQK